MERRKAADFPRGLLDLFREYQQGHIDRRSFLNGAGRFAVGGLTVGAIFEMMRPNYAWAQQVAQVTHPASARVLDRLRTP
jgi:carboxymethylenebutenolidase